MKLPHLRADARFVHLDQEMQYVRTILRVRDRHIREAAEAIQHMQKSMPKMNGQRDQRALSRLYVGAPSAAPRRLPIVPILPAFSKLVVREILWVGLTTL
jgi:hypothetical protein